MTWTGLLSNPEVYLGSINVDTRGKLAGWEVGLLLLYSSTTAAAI